MLIRWAPSPFRSTSIFTLPRPKNPFLFASVPVYSAHGRNALMTTPEPQRRYWIFAEDPRNYHWDTLFVKGKEMWRGAGSKLVAQRQLKLVGRGDRVLCYHGPPDRWIYALAEATRDAYPDPQEPGGKSLVIDIRAIERLPRPVPLTELRANPALRRVRLLKNLRLTICPLTQDEYKEILRMAGIVAAPGMPLP